MATSLVSEGLGGDGRLRFSMLETVREYALEQLEASGEGDEAPMRHAEHFAVLAEAADDDSSTPEDAALIEEELDNLRAAIDWSAGSGAVELELRLVAALVTFWAVHDHLREGRARVEAALERSADGPAPLRARALGGASWVALRLGDYEQAVRLAEESLAVYRSLGDEHGVAGALNRLGAAVSGLGDVARATSLQRESADMYRRLGDDRGLATVLSNLGYRLLCQGEFEQGRLLCDEALSLARKRGDRSGMPLALVNLGLATFLQERYAEALSYYRDGLEVGEQLGYVVYTIYCLDGFAAVLAETGAAEEAATIAAAAEAAAESRGVSLEPLERSIHEHTVETAKQALGDETFDTVWTVGYRLTVGEAARRVLSTGQPAAKAVR